MQTGLILVQGFLQGVFDHQILSMKRRYGFEKIYDRDPCGYYSVNSMLMDYTQEKKRKSRLFLPLFFVIEP